MMCSGFFEMVWQRHGLEPLPGTGLASHAFGALVVLCRFLGPSRLGAAGRALSHRELRSSRGVLRALHHEVARVFLPGAESSDWVGLRRQQQIHIYIR